MAMDNELFKELSQKLDNPDAKYRLAVIENLSGYSDIKAIRLLLKALGDNSNQNRTRAGQLLMEVDHPSAISGVVAMLDSEQFHVKATVLQLLENQPSEKVFPVIKRLVNDPKLEESLRRSLIPLYIGHCDSSSQNEIDELLNNADSETRKAAVDGLCKNKNDWVIPHLIRLLGKENRSTSINVVKALSRRNSHLDLIKKLLEIVKEKGQKGDEATSVLSQIVDKPHYLLVIDLLTHAKGLVRRRGLQIAESVDPQATIEYAFDLLNDDDVNVAHQAERLLGSRSFQDLVGPITSRFQTNPQESSRNLQILADTAKNLTPDELVDIIFDPAVDPRVLKVVNSHLSAKDGNIIIDRFKKANEMDRKNYLSTLSRLQRKTELQAIFKTNSFDDKDDLINDCRRELMFRKLLDSNQIHHMHLVLDEIFQKANDAGWTGDRSILISLEVSGSASDIADKRSQLQEAIRHKEKKVLELEAKLEAVTDQISRETQKHTNRAVFVLMVILGSISALVCLYMNWQPKQSGLWYPGLVLSTIVAATGIFGYRKTLKKKPGKSRKKNPVEQQDRLSEKLQKAIESLSKHQSELDVIEKSILAGKTEDMKANDLAELIKILKTNLLY